MPLQQTSNKMKKNKIIHGIKILSLITLLLFIMTTKAVLATNDPSSVSGSIPVSSTPTPATAVYVPPPINVLPSGTTNLMPVGNAAPASPSTGYTTLSPLPCISSATVNCGSGGNGSLMNQVDINGYVQKMFNLFIAITGVAAVFMLVLGGFEYMTTDAFSGKENARARLSNAVKGLLLVLCSFLILRTINPKLVDIPINLVPPLGIKINSNTIGFLNDLSSGLDTLDSQAAIRNQTILTTISNNQAQIGQLQSLKAAILASGTPDAQTRAATVDAQIATLVNQNDGLTADSFVINKTAALHTELTTAAKNGDNVVQTTQNIANEGIQAAQKLAANNQPAAAQEMTYATIYTTGTGLITSVNQAIENDSGHFGVSGYVQSNYDTNIKPELLAGINALPDGSQQKSQLQSQMTKLESDIKTYESGFKK